MAHAALSKLLRMGNPKLRNVAKPFTREEITKPETQEMVKEMFKVLRQEGGAGLAAPQIGIQKQAVVVEIGDVSPDITPIPPKVLFNPTLEVVLKHETIKIWESCLSVPGLAGKVPRYNNVLVHYLDEDGRKKRLAATGYLAGLFQHEIDHLNGVLYVDHMDNIKDLCFEEEYMEHRSADPEDCYEGTVRFFDK